MPISANTRVPAALSYVQDLEYRKELARLIARSLEDISTLDLLNNPTKTLEEILTDILQGLTTGPKGDLLTAAGRSAIEHLPSLGIESAEIADMLIADLPEIIASTSSRIIMEADRLLGARADDIRRTVERMIAEGASQEAVLAGLTEGAGKALLAPIYSGMTQTAAGLVTGVDQAVTNEALRLDSAAAAGAQAFETEAEFQAAVGVTYAWETRGDEKVCDDIYEDSCAPRDGDELPLEEWEALGLPGAENLICSIFARGAFSMCRCKLIRSDKAEKFPAPLDVRDAAKLGQARAQSEMPSSAKAAGVSLEPSRKQVTSSGAPLSQILPPSSQVSIIPEPSSSLTNLATYTPTEEGAISTSTALGPKVAASIQPPGDVKSFLKTAGEKTPELRVLTSSVAEKNPGVNMPVEPRVKKNLFRIAEKLEWNNNNPRALTDYLGSRLFVEDKESMDLLIPKLGKHFDIVKFDNFLENGKLGYRAIHLDVRLSDGFVAEVQIIPTQVGLIKDAWEDSVYVKWRKYGKPPVAGGPPVALPKELVSAYMRDITAMENAFNEAYRRWLAGEPVLANELRPGLLQFRTIGDEWQAFFRGEFAVDKTKWTAKEIADLAAKEEGLGRTFGISGYGKLQTPEAQAMIEPRLAQAMEAGTVYTPAMKADALTARFGEAAIGTGKGELTFYHITQDPEKLFKALNAGADPMSTFTKGNTAQFGPGLYGSSVPESWAFWANRSGFPSERFSFLYDLPTPQRKALGEKILASIGEAKLTEYPNVRQVIRNFVENGSTVGLRDLTFSPFNVPFYEKAYLEPLGITPSGPRLHVVKIRVKGTFLDVARAKSRNMWISDAQTLRELGYDGAFVAEAAEPGQIVIWNRSAIISWELDDAAIVERMGTDGGNYFQAGYAAGVKVKTPIEPLLEPPPVARNSAGLTSEEWLALAKKPYGELTAAEKAQYLAGSPYVPLEPPKTGRELLNRLFKVGEPGFEGANNDVVKAALDTAGMTPASLNSRLGKAGLSEMDGQITIWTVTSDPDLIMSRLNMGNFRFSRAGATLGPGLYGSGDPNLWRNRTALAGKEPQLVKLRLRGKFLDLTKASFTDEAQGWRSYFTVPLGDPEVALLRGLGFDGAFVNELGGPPEFVIWNRDAITSWEITTEWPK